MSPADEYTSYPLSASLTQRVVGYLNVYRMIITVLLAAAVFGQVMNAGPAGKYLTMGSVVVTAYLLFAAFHLFSARRTNADFFKLASFSLFSDIFFLSALVVVSAGAESSLGILLVFASATAAVLLPLRIGLLLASIASLSLVGTALWTFFHETGSPEALLQAGLFSVTAMVAAVMANKLAYWARDYRLIAEKQKETLSELEQVNELIIRRMRTGVVAVDEDGMIRVMNESAWFLLGSPPVRQRALKSLSPRLDRALEHWKTDMTSDSMPISLEPSQAQVLPGFVALPGEAGFGGLIFLNDNNVVARRAV